MDLFPGLEIEVLESVEISLRKSETFHNKVDIRCQCFWETQHKEEAFRLILRLLVTMSSFILPSTYHIMAHPICDDH